MHVQEMITTHPQERGQTGAALIRCIEECYDCAQTCTACADACLGETMVQQMTQCIRTCLDCADVCEATGKLAVRRTGSNEAVLKEMLEVCARICDSCAAECEKHDHEHCRLCAQMCRECAEDCRNAAASITPES